LQPPRLASTAPGTGKSAGPAEPCQMFDTLLLGTKLDNKLSQPSHSSPLRSRTFHEPVLPGQGCASMYMSSAVPVETIRTSAPALGRQVFAPADTTIL